MLTPDNEITRLMPLKRDSVLGLSAMFDQLVDDLQAFLLRHTNDAGGVICNEESLQLRTKRSTIRDEYIEDQRTSSPSGAICTSLWYAGCLAFASSAVTDLYSSGAAILRECQRLDLKASNQNEGL